MAGLCHSAGDSDHGRIGEPRAVAPPDLGEAFDHDAGARRFFDGLSYSNKRRIVMPIEGAKTAETRQRRIAKAITALREGRA